MFVSTSDSCTTNRVHKMVAEGKSSAYPFSGFSLFLPAFLI